MDGACLWVSRADHGAAALQPALLRLQADTGIELGFDGYFLGAYHCVERTKNANAPRPNTGAEG